MQRRKGTSAESAEGDSGVSGASSSPYPAHPARSHDPGHHDGHHHHIRGSSTSLSALDQTKFHQQHERLRSTPCRALHTSAQECAALPGQQLSPMQAKKQTNKHFNDNNTCAFPLPHSSNRASWEILTMEAGEWSLATVGFSPPQELCIVLRKKISTNIKKKKKNQY